MANAVNIKGSKHMNKRQKHHFFERMKATSLLTTNQKEIVFGFLREALNLPKEQRITRVRTKSLLMTLPVWEAANGALAWPALRDWAMRKKLCPKTVEELIEEFRLEMQSKSKEYADFVATFQTYLNKGYLSKKLPQVLWVNSPYRKQEGVTKMQAGASI